MDPMTGKMIKQALYNVCQRWRFYQKDLGTIKAPEFVSDRIAETYFALQAIDHRSDFAPAMAVFASELGLTQCNLQDMGFCGEAEERAREMIARATRMNDYEGMIVFIKEISSDLLERSNTGNIGNAGHAQA